MSTSGSTAPAPGKAAPLVDNERLARTITWVAAAMALFITLVAPASYFVISYRAAQKEGAIAARLHAAFIMQSIRANADWRTHVPGLLDTNLAQSEYPEQRQVTDFMGNVLASSGQMLDWPVLSQSTKLVTSDGPVGEVLVHRSMRPLVLSTFGVAMLAALLGVGIYVSLRTLPLRALRRAMEALKTEEMRAREEAEAHLRIVFEHAIDGILIFTPQGMVSSANPAAGALFGCSARELHGLAMADLMQSTNVDQAATVFLPGRREVLAKRRGAAAFAVDLAVSETRFAGEPQRIGILRDITERKQQEQRLSQLASFDSLTGLPNRSMFRERLHMAMGRSQTTGRAMALMFLDLDRFKTINDSLGHDVGDQLLIQVSRVLDQCMREDAGPGSGRRANDTNRTVYRLGGDEFTVLAEDLGGPEAAAALAQRILEAFARPFHIKDEELFVSTSIGVTVYPQDHNDLDGLIKQADMAMYRSKALGRDTYFFYNQHLNVEATERHAMEASLRHALERGEFYLHYQPKADIRSGRITGVEALMRWRSPGPVSPGPDKFIPILEETGLIVPVGVWVLREACTQMMAWRRQGLKPIKLAVNLSARQFRQQDIVGQIAQVLRDTGFEAQYLEVELTESMLIQDGDEAVRILNNLGAMGVSLAIDDFGTGHSSLSYLKRFNVDTLKIDRSFVKDTPGDAEDCAIAVAVIALAHSLRLRVVAEGVDNIKQVEFLRSNGCDEIQGYLLSKPQDPQWLLHWLLKREGEADKPVVEDLSVT